MFFLFSTYLHSREKGPHDPRCLTRLTRVHYLPNQMHSAGMRVRHAMAFATHKFFNDRGFLYIHTPIVTGADCEGAGEQFAVSTLLPEGGENGGGGGGVPMTSTGAVDYTKAGWSGCVLLYVMGTHYDFEGIILTLISTADYFQSISFCMFFGCCSKITEHVFAPPST